MSKAIKATIEVQGATITVVPHDGHDLISLTDIAKYKNPDRVIPRGVEPSTLCKNATDQGSWPIISSGTASARSSSGYCRAPG
jgi:hypothetical protein